MIVDGLTVESYIPTAVIVSKRLKFGILTEDDDEVDEDVFGDGG